MKILITGGAGFIGSHLAERLLAEGKRIVVVDNFDDFYDRSIKIKNIKNQLKSPNYTLIEADIRSRRGMERIFSKHRPDQVVHLAAKAGVRPSLKRPDQYVSVNVKGTENLLHASVKYGVRHFAFASSSSVYGTNTKVPFAETDPILQPASPYGATKAAGEALCNSYSHCFGLPIAALRFFTVYGPRQRPDLAIHHFVSKIVSGEPITLFGDGTSSRDYTYIDDIVTGICGAMNYMGDGYEIFNLGNSTPIPLTEMVKTIEDVLDKKAIIKWKPMQTGDVPQTWADLEKSGKLLGYSPQTDFRPGVERFVKWYVETI